MDWTYTPPPTWTVRKLIQELTEACERQPEVADYEAFAADDCTSACDTAVSSIIIESGKTRVTVGG